MIELKVNGKVVQFRKNLFLSDLLDQLEVSPKMLIVTLNGEVVHRDKLQQQMVTDQDEIELIRLVGGG
jgi:sulfur carrier protein